MKSRLIKTLVIIVISIAVLFFAGIYLVNKAFEILVLSQVGDLNIYQELEEELKKSFSDNSGIFQLQEQYNQEKQEDSKADDSEDFGTSDQDDITNSDAVKSPGAGGNTGMKETGTSKTVTPGNRTAENNDINEPVGNTGENAMDDGKTEYTSGEKGKENSTGNNEKDGADNSNNKDKGPNDGKTSGTSQQEVAITVDRVKELESKVSLSDKGKALQIVASRLKPEDISLLSSMVKNGITAEEIEKAKKILKERVTEEEKEFLKSLISKYNVLP